jgi:hypothetical protein
MYELLVETLESADQSIAVGGPEFSQAWIRCHHGLNPRLDKRVLNARFNR